ncbi:MAG: YqaJ viral recombinase family protein [Methyloprofundus sp.]|nr:YqaJ viral recombinase family protein [Methyloprofundus sp.]
MNAQSTPFSFEQSILNSGVDLSHFEKSAPFKTAEEIRRDWLLERIGKFTASEFHRLITAPTKKELPVGAITYVQEKVTEELTEFLDDSFISTDMQWGLDHELDAIAAFEQRKGLKVSHTGNQQSFISLGEHVGGTPDGLIGKHSGAEIKCPKSSTHFQYLSITNQEDLKNTCPNYYWQIQGLLYITKRKHWYFITYDPRFKDKEQQLHFIEVKPNAEDQKFLAGRLAMAIEYKSYLLLKMREKFSPLINQATVLKILKIGRTKLWKLRKTDKFPNPVQANPLLWKLTDIESYTIKKH